MRLVRGAVATICLAGLVLVPLRGTAQDSLSDDLQKLTDLANRSLAERPPNSLQNEIVVNQPFETVWDLLIGELAKSFFVINNVEKASRIINLSFSIADPESYVDCGRSRRTLTEGGKETVYDYAVAESNAYKIAAKWGDYNHLPVEAIIRRETSLEGRANIYVAPQGRRTVATANARYVLSVETSGVANYKNAFGGVARVENLPQRTKSISFNTNQSSSANWGTPEEPTMVTCHSNGSLESQLLGLAGSPD